MRAGLPRQRSTELVRSPGRPGENCPGFGTGLVPDAVAFAVWRQGAAARVRRRPSQAPEAAVPEDHTVTDPDDHAMTESRSS
jgi:hypothetical protein